MRLLAGLSVPREDITGMGVGGLLMEIVTRPQPRDEPLHPVPQRRRAGARRRPFDAAWAGRTSFSPRSAAAARAHRRDEVLRSRARPIIVVTGHQRERVEAALAGCRSISSTIRNSPMGSRHLAQNRRRRGAGAGRRRHRLPRRHAAGRRRADRPPHRRARSRRGRARRLADHRRASAAIRCCGRGASFPTSWPSKATSARAT